MPVVNINERFLTLLNFYSNIGGNEDAAFSMSP